MTGSPISGGVSDWTFAPALSYCSLRLAMSLRTFLCAALSFFSSASSLKSKSASASVSDDAAARPRTVVRVGTPRQDGTAGAQPAEIQLGGILENDLVVHLRHERLLGRGDLALGRIEAKAVVPARESMRRGTVSGSRAQVQRLLGSVVKVHAEHGIELSPANVLDLVRRGFHGWGPGSAPLPRA